MKIVSIKLLNHPILGSLNLDFADAQGNACDTIIIAGENGTGKSVFLNLLYYFPNFELSDKKRSERWDIEVELTETEKQTLIQVGNQFEPLSTVKTNKFIFVFDFSIGQDWQQITFNGTNTEGQPIKITGNHFHTAIPKSIFKFIFSDVEINFNSGNVSSITTLDIDKEFNSSVRSSTNLAQQITQLLVDIQSIDALEFSEYYKAQKGQSIDEAKLDKRIKRFANAFASVFPTKRLKGIENRGNEKTVLFEEYGNEVALNNLSSGEKQIVFRGGFLLKDKNSSEGTPVLIDEPEISLHPEWQLKIMSFFKNLFTNEKGEQTSQLFVVTHSPFILHNAQRSLDKVLIFKRDKENGKTCIEQEPKFYGWTPEEVVLNAFNVQSLTITAKNIIFVEGITDEMYLKEAAKYISGSFNFEIHWIGAELMKGREFNTGDSALDSANLFFKANPFIANQKIILLYDNDVDKKDESTNNIYVKSMPKEQLNKQYQKGIESLLVLGDNFNYVDFISSSKRKDGYGCENQIQTLDKKKLAEHLIQLPIAERQKILSRLTQILIELN